MTKRIITYIGLSLATFSVFLVVGTANAQMMGGYNGSYGSMMGGWTYPGASSTTMSASDTQAIADGKALYGQLQAGQAQCSQLTQDNYDQLGEYFMDQMTGSGHAAMDSMLSSMMGQQGDTAMHIALGERYSGCDPNAALPAGAMMGYGNYDNGASSTPYQNNFLNNMMGYGYGGYGPMGYGYADPLGWIFMLLFWALIVIGVIVLIRWLGHGRHRHGWHEHGHSAMDVLKERYAKGEIDKREFEEKKKDLE